GEYLVSAGSVERLHEFYNRVRTLPYKPGPAKELADAYRTISSNRSSTIYEGFTTPPAGLAAVIQPRWLLSLPGWAKARIAGVAVWQWFALTSCLIVGALFVFGATRLARRLARGRADDAGPGWHLLLTPLAVTILCGLLAPLLTRVLRLG